MVLSRCKYEKTFFKETSVRMSDRSGGRIRRRGDPFIMDRSSNGRPKKPQNKKFSRDDSEEIECDIQEEMSMIDNRVVVGEVKDS